MTADILYALRMLRKNPGFTLVAVLSLALGTGANSAMFSMADAMLLRPLPVARADEILTLSVRKGPNPGGHLAYPDYLDYRRLSKTMEGLVACAPYRFGFAVAAKGTPQVKYGLLVSGNLFSALGVQPAVGRTFRPDEDVVPGRDAVVVLGYDFWQERFGGDPQAVGSAVRLNGVTFTVIGAAPQGFRGLYDFYNSAVFVPMMMEPRLAADPRHTLLENRDGGDFMVKGRMRPGLRIAQAQAELDSIANGLDQAYPSKDYRHAVVVRPEIQARAQDFPQQAQLLTMLAAMAALVLVVSCFNVANLLLSRARSRSHEIAVRLAMGAGRLRLVRQLLTESLLLGLAGSFCGLWMAWASMVFLRRLKLPSDLPLLLNFQIDYRVLAFSVAAAMASVLLFGLAPAIQGTRLDLVPALRSSDSDASGRRRLWGRNLLVVGQVAISLVLLAVAGMLYRGFRGELATGVGFRTRQMLMMSFDPRLVRYTGSQIQEFFRRLVERAALAPGVKSVALAVILPLDIRQRVYSELIVPEGASLPKGQSGFAALSNIVDENYFATMGIAMLQGRGFLATDKAGAPRVAVVNEALARNTWPGQSALGKRFRLAGSPTAWIEVVGVTRTGKYAALTEAPTGFLFLPVAQYPQNRLTLIAESYRDSASVLGPLREVVRSLDPNMPIYDVRTMEDFFEAYAVSTPNWILSMVASIGLLGLSLAAIGLYGLVSYSVSCRTREFGIRMAIGATASQVLGMVLRQGMALAAGGVVLGLAVSLVAGRLVKALVATAAADPAPYVAVPILLIAVTLGAAYLPARRASRIDPMKALRYE